MGIKRTRRPQAGARMERDSGQCAACGKVSYATRKKALAANQYRSVIPGRTVKLRPYRCGEVWHLTSWSAAKMAAWKDYCSEGKAS
jgi:ribosomal protein L37E